MLRMSVIGNLGKDPEMRYTPNGKAVCEFSVAVNGKRDADGEQTVTWVRCTAWERTAENAAEYLRKGSKVYVDGRPEAHAWADKHSNEPRASLELTVSYLEFLSTRQDGEQTERQARPDTRGPGDPSWRTAGGSPRPHQPVAAGAERAAPDDSFGDLDDLPF